MKTVNDSFLLHIKRRLRLRASYRKLFCNEDGTMKPEAEDVLADWARLSKYNDSVLVTTLGKTDIPGTFSAIGMQSLLKRALLMCRFDDSDLADAEKNVRQSEANMMGVSNG